MSRHTAPTRNIHTRLVLDVDGERDESSGYRHEWRTRVRLGLLVGTGRNQAEALSNLADEVHALVSSEAALEARARARMPVEVAKPVAERPPPPFRDEEPIEVFLHSGWVPAIYEGQTAEGRHKVYVSGLLDLLDLPREKLRAVNSEPPASVD